MTEIKTPDVKAELTPWEGLKGPAGGIEWYADEQGNPIGFHFQCPCGCGDIGHVVVAGNGAWKWNGSKEAPTVHPSVLLYTARQPHWHGWLKDGVWKSC